MYFMLPQAVVRPSGGHVVNLYWTMFNIYGIRPHEVSEDIVCMCGTSQGMAVMS